MLLRITLSISLTLISAAAPLSAAPMPAAKATMDKALTEILEQAFGDDGDKPAGGRELFLATLESDLFLHEAVGPFGLYVFLADDLAKPAAARKVLKNAVKGMQGVARLMDEHFTRDDGLVSGRRFPLVLASSDKGESGFDQLLALLDHCEDGDFSGWKPVNQVWTPENRSAEVVRTWEVQLFNLAHETIAGQKKKWFEHGIGYYASAHIANRLLRQGAWGMAPPWLAQGLIDEVDIQSNDEAWVGGDWWTQQTPGWFRAGWSGFVPQGSSPPPPVMGPPATLAVTVKNSGNSWAHRSNSGERHWSDLATDRKSEAPASFAFMAEHESFLPRDRAYARCVLHIMLEVAPTQGASLFELLDTETGTARSGMPEAEPLTVLFCQALGGVAAVDEVESMELGAMLERIGKPGIAESIRKLRAEGLLAIPDHREQGEWLYQQSSIDMPTRQKLFNLILEAEYHQQLYEWQLIGEVLDRGADAALEASRRYPKRAKDKLRAGEAFWGAFAGDS